ncbi:MAG: hypothetical protein ABI782_06395 [Anaerolineaceae bacterium]
MRRQRSNGSHPAEEILAELEHGAASRSASYGRAREAFDGLPGGPLEFARAVVLRKSLDRRDHVLERREGPNLGTEFVAASAEHGPAVGGRAAGNFSSQPGLPDARLASDQHDAAFASRGGDAAKLGDAFQFTASTDEHRAGDSLHHGCE